MTYAILTTKNSRNAGGLCGAIAGITREANRSSNVIDLISFNDEFSEEDLIQYGNTRNYSYSVSTMPGLSSLGYSPDLSKILEQVSPLVVDVQGLWMYNSWAALKYQKKHPETKKVITPHGMLDPWALRNSAWKKKLVGRLFEYENLQTADCLHALCRSEYESIRLFGLKNPVAIIPNGIELPEAPKFNRGKEKKILLYIGRIHPKKGIKELVEAVAILKQQHPSLLKNWNLRIVGWNQQGHQEELLSLVESLKISGVITFAGPMFGEDKEKELCAADAFILPSFSEGLPMSILEAWSYKLPCIMTDFCNLQEGFDFDAAIRIEPKPKSIVKGLIQLMNMSDYERFEMGARGYQLCSQKFTWSVVADMKIQLYEWLVCHREKPSFVIDK